VSVVDVPHLLPSFSPMKVLENGIQDAHHCNRDVPISIKGIICLAIDVTNIGYPFLAANIAWYRTIVNLHLCCGTLFNPSKGAGYSNFSELILQNRPPDTNLM